MLTGALNSTQAADPGRVAVVGGSSGGGGSSSPMILPNSSLMLLLLRRFCPRLCPGFADPARVAVVGGSHGGSSSHLPVLDLTGVPNVAPAPCVHVCRPRRPGTRGGGWRLPRRLPHRPPGGAEPRPLQVRGAAQPGVRHKPHDPRWVGGWEGLMGGRGSWVGGWVGVLAAPLLRCGVRCAHGGPAQLGACLCDVLSTPAWRRAPLWSHGGWTLAAPWRAAGVWGWVRSTPTPLMCPCMPLTLSGFSRSERHPRLVLHRGLGLRGGQAPGGRAPHRRRRAALLGGVAHCARGQGKHGGGGECVEVWRARCAAPG